MNVILVVDGEPMILRLSRTVLERAGHQVVTVDSGKVAFEIAPRLERIHLILVEHWLREHRGCDVAARVLLHHPAMKVIHMSGWSREHLEQESAFLPGSSFLPKPFTAQQLQELVAASVAG